MALALTAMTVLPPSHALAQQPVNGNPSTGPASAAAAPATLPSLDQLGAILVSSQSRPEQRDEAARRLVARQDVASRRILADALLNTGQIGAQVSTAKALAENPQLDPSLIYPLFSALPVPQVSPWASRALANYRDDRDVYLGFVTRIDGPGRVAIESVRRDLIRGLGSFVEKETAEFLIRLIRAPNESPATRQAIVDALTELTGLTDIGQDANRWIAWWQQNAGRAETEFRAEMLARRSARLDQLRLDLSEVSQALSALIRQTYQEATGGRKQELLLSWLKSPRAEERFIAAGLILEDLTTSVPVSAAARERLREMIGDTSPKVRLRVATALYQINDAESIDLLLAQLSIETDPQVRAALAQAIAPIRSIKAVPALVKLLNDTYIPAVLEAAQALETLGQTIREQNPSVAEQTARALRDKLQQVQPDPRNAELREALVDAMVPLRQQAVLQDTLLQILRREQGNESAGMRRLAIKAIGEFGDSKLAPTIFASLADDEASARLEAVTALGKLPASVESVAPLLALLGPTEPDPSIRNQAWIVLESIFPHLTKGVLNDLELRFRADNSRRISVLKALRDILVKNKELDELADVHWNIGTALLNDPKRPGTAPDPAAAREAATYIRLALEYRLNEPNPQELAIEGTTRDLIKALLRSGQFPEAITFASECIRRDVRYQQTMGTSIVAEAQELRRNGKFDDVLRLIELTEAMTPRLDEQYQKSLENEKRLAIDQRNLQGVSPGQFPTRPVPQINVRRPTTRPQGSVSARD